MILIMKTKQIFPLILLFLVGCVNSKDISITLKEKLNRVESGSMFIMSDMTDAFDSAYVVTPYTQDLPLDENVKYEEGLRDEILTKWGCPENMNILLFVAHGEVTVYAKIERHVADFAGLSKGVKLYPNQKLFMAEHRKVQIVK